MKNYCLKTIFLFVIFVPILLLSNETDSTKKDSIYFTYNPGFRSFQIDFASLIFLSELGVNLDYDFYKVDTSKVSGVGFRVNHEMYMRSEPGGGTFGTPFYFSSLYLRATTASKSFRLDIYSGLSYLFKSESKEKLFVFKVGGEIKYMIGADVLGFFIKANGTPDYAGEGFNGIGLYMGIGNANL